MSRCNRRKEPHIRSNTRQLDRNETPILIPIHQAAPTIDVPRTTKTKTYARRTHAKTTGHLQNKNCSTVNVQDQRSIHTTRLSETDRPEAYPSTPSKEPWLRHTLSSHTITVVNKPSRPTSPPDFNRGLPLGFLDLGERQAGACSLLSPRTDPLPPNKNKTK